MSGASKLFALASTYPYQVVRSRIQVRLPLTRPLLPSLHPPRAYSRPSRSRTTPPRTCTRRSPRASRRRGQRRACAASTAGWARTSCASCPGRASPSSCTRTSRGSSAQAPPREPGAQRPKAASRSRRDREDVGGGRQGPYREPLDRASPLLRRQGYMVHMDLDRIFHIPTSAPASAAYRCGPRCDWVQGWERAPCLRSTYTHAHTHFRDTSPLFHVR